MVENRKSFSTNITSLEEMLFISIKSVSSEMLTFGLNKSEKAFLC